MTITFDGHLTHLFKWIYSVLAQENEVSAMGSWHIAYYLNLMKGYICEFTGSVNDRGRFSVQYFFLLHNIYLT